MEVTPDLFPAFVAIHFMLANLILFLTFPVPIITSNIVVAPGFAAVVSKSTNNSYNDHGMKWDNSGKNGFYSRFVYSP